jgi:hypothetical protein
MDVSMQEALWSVVADVGSKRGLVIAGGGALALLGLVGLVLSTASIRQTVPEGERPPRRLLIVGSVVLMAIAA